MHKKAMEMAKHAMEDACAKGYDCMTSQDWDNFKDCVETAEKFIKAEYYCLIIDEMKEYKEEEEAEEKYMMRMLKEEHKDEYKRMREQYGEEDGERRFYDNYRHANGRFARKGTGMYEPRHSGRRRGYEEPPYYHMTPEQYKEHDASWYRDMDRDSGRLYFTEPMRHDGIKHEESRYDKARRGYEETKMAHKSNTPEDKSLTMKEMEKVLNVVFDEIDEMLEDAPTEMKNMVKTKGMTRFQKIQ